jgi:tRNA nucleotidyltransferase (CCA-adding enzyme)
LPTEEKIFSTIVQLLDLVSPSKKIAARVAGGWVRDKLLGLESDDIDVVIDTISVALLARLIKENHPTKVQNISHLPANPAMHKSLDNTMMTICDTHIDFVNLRADSSSEIGTPESDALNRDLTVNALFYNLRTKEVEDFTGSGFEDVKNKILRTPQSPEITWGQDPLRMIRTARFAGKSDFTLHESLIVCLNKPETMNLLLEVAAERKIIEVDKILKVSRPLISLEQFFKYHMHEAVFTKEGPSAWREVHRKMAWSCVKYVFENLIEGEDHFNKSVLFYSFSLLPFLVTDPEQFPFTKYAMSQRWRVNNKCANTAFDMLMTASQWVAILKDFESANGELDPAIPARIIRSLGAKWQQSYIIAQVVQTLLKLKTRYEEEKEVEADLAIDEEVKARFDKLSKYLETNNLMRAFEILPLIQTSKLLYMLDEKQGPVAGYLSAHLLDWQFRHPNGTREECEQFMREWWTKEKPNFNYKKK